MDKSRSQVASSLSDTWQAFLQQLLVCFYRQLSQQISDVINPDRGGNTAGFLNLGFLALLDEDFVDNADDLAAGWLIKQAATVAGIGGGVTWVYAIGRGEAFFAVVNTAKSTGKFSRAVRRGEIAITVAAANRA